MDGWKEQPKVKELSKQANAEHSHHVYVKGTSVETPMMFEGSKRKQRIP